MPNPTYGILLVNLGTPKSYQPGAVFSYLNEFLTDARVIDIPWVQRQLLVRGIIVPTRFKQSAKLYEQVWTAQGSPLLVHGKNLTQALQGNLGSDFKVSLAMRYQNPSIQEGLEELKKANVKEILIFPLFPQYASATTGSVHQKVMEIVGQWLNIPKLTFINNFATHPSLIESFCAQGRQHQIDSYDHVLFSFHGLPERQIQKADPCGVCLKAGCCDKISSNNQFCYKAQCYATARHIVSELGLSPDRYTICFQSRLGKEPWVQPFTMDCIKSCAEKGHKKLLVFCPSFVCDCLETTCEISYEYATEFKHLGGERLDLVEGLNCHPVWVQAVKTIVLENLGLLKEKEKCANKEETSALKFACK